MGRDLDIRRVISVGIVFAFLFNTFGPLPMAQANELLLPKPGVMVNLSPAYSPAVLKGIKLDPKNPFSFHFFVDSGDEKLSQGELKDESAKLIKYFLASLTVPEKDLWVNLSPYEKNRIVPQGFGQTEMGRDLLAEDYLLKQITASLIYPNSQTGKEFWQKVYAQAQAKYGTTNIPINTFNKVWIVPEKAVVYENAGTAFVLENHLKVMLEEDYLSLQKHQRQPGDMTSVVSPSTLPSDQGLNVKAPQVNNGLTSENTNALGSQIVREIVIPALTKEVNEGKNFSHLRQVVYSLVLATWYKKKIKDSILNKIYSNRNKISGVRYEHSVIADKGAATPDTERIYQRYLHAFKEGVYNYIKEEPDPITNEIIPRKYFSGGVSVGQIFTNIEFHSLAMITPQDMATLSKLTEVDGDTKLSTSTPSLAQASKPVIENLLGGKTFTGVWQAESEPGVDAFGVLEYAVQHGKINAQQIHDIMLMGGNGKGFAGLVKILPGRNITVGNLYSEPLKEIQESEHLAEAGTVRLMQVDGSKLDSNRFPNGSVDCWVMRGIDESAFGISHKLVDVKAMMQGIINQAVRVVRPQGYVYDSLGGLNQEFYEPLIKRGFLIRIDSSTYIRTSKPADEAMTNPEDILRQQIFVEPGKEAPTDANAATFETASRTSQVRKFFESATGAFLETPLGKIPLRFSIEEPVRGQIPIQVFPFSTDINSQAYSEGIAKHSSLRPLFYKNRLSLPQRGALGQVLIRFDKEDGGVDLWITANQSSRGYRALSMNDQLPYRAWIEQTHAMIKAFAHSNHFRVRAVSAGTAEQIYLNVSGDNLRISYVDPYKQGWRLENIETPRVIRGMFDYRKISAPPEIQVWTPAADSRAMITGDDIINGVFSKDPEAEIKGVTRKQIAQALNLPEDDAGLERVIEEMESSGDLVPYYTTAVEAFDKTDFLAGKITIDHFLEQEKDFYRRQGKERFLLAGKLLSGVTDSLKDKGLPENQLQQQNQRMLDNLLLLIGNEMNATLRRTFPLTLMSEMLGFRGYPQDEKETAEIAKQVGIISDEIKKIQAEMTRMKFLSSVPSNEIQGRLDEIKKVMALVEKLQKEDVSPLEQRLRADPQKRAKDLITIMSFEQGRITGLIHLNMVFEIYSALLSAQGLHQNGEQNGLMESAATTKAGSAAMTITQHLKSPQRTAEGGINLNPAQMDMQVKKEGDDFKFDFNGIEIDAAQVTGATFIIHQMTPVTNLPLILGLNQGPANSPHQG